LGRGSIANRLARFRAAHDTFRSAVVNEPRGSDVMVGALLAEPVDPKAVAGVIFFNNVGYLGMCGHGTIGVVATLAHMGRIEPGEHLIETPVGTVKTVLHDSREVTVENVPSYRTARQVPVQVEGYGWVAGDVAWGGNWFFLVEKHKQEIALENVERLTECTWRIRQSLAHHGITGEGGAEIDHVELFGPPRQDGAHSKNFVLCPGKAYDRSPCGTGTSAKLACLAADGKLKPGEAWRQEGILGSVFEGSYQEAENGRVIPSIKGAAYVNAEATLLLERGDPFCMGIRATA
jgi:4-hydroxyproline epimerase